MQTRVALDTRPRGTIAPIAVPRNMKIPMTNQLRDEPLVATMTMSNYAVSLQKFGNEN